MQRRRILFGLGERERGGIDAELIFGCGANQGFGVNGAGEMHVQVGAFGHFGEEEFEFEGVGASGFEGARGFQFGGCKDLAGRGDAAKMIAIAVIQLATRRERDGICMATLSEFLW